MHELYKKCKDGNLKHFLELLISEHISLISKEEAVDRSFLLHLHLLGFQPGVEVLTLQCFPFLLMNSFFCLFDQ